MLKAGLEEIIAGARAAEVHADWGASLKLWAKVQEHAAGHVEACIGRAIALRKLDRFGECEELLSRSIAKVPECVRLHCEYAQTAAARGDWVEAAERYHMLLRHFPNDPAAIATAGLGFRAAKLFEEAEGVLKRGIELHPDNKEIVFGAALVATDRGHWPEAKRRWDDAWERFPNAFDEVTQFQRGSASMSLYLDLALENNPKHEMDTSVTESSYAEQAPSAAKTMISLKEGTNLIPTKTRDLALSFESIGATCEFGLVQRHLGAEPLGLFRFSYVQLAHLISLLDQNLEGLGDPSNTHLYIHDLEYVVADRRGVYTAHSFVRAGAVDERKFLEQQCRKLNFLRKKFLEELKMGEKIFVYRREHDREIAEEEIFEIHRALSRHGPNALLVVKPEEPGHPLGSLELLKEGVMVAYLGRGYSFPDWSKLSVDRWREVCRKALMLRRTSLV